MGNKIQLVRHYFQKKISNSFVRTRTWTLLYKGNKTKQKDVSVVWIVYINVPGYVTCSFRAKKWMSLNLFLVYPPRDWVQPINLIHNNADHQTDLTLKGPQPEINQFWACSAVLKSSWRVFLASSYSPSIIPQKKYFTN